MNLCYIFQCERRPPSEEEMKGLKDQFTKNEKKEDEILEKEDEILDKVVVDEQLIPQGQGSTGESPKPESPKKEKEVIDLDQSA